MGAGGCACTRSLELSNGEKRKKQPEGRVFSGATLAAGHHIPQYIYSTQSVIVVDIS